MVVGDLYVGRSCRRPFEADAVLVVDPDRVLAGTVPCQFLQTVPGRDTKVVDALGRAQEPELFLCSPAGSTWTNQAQLRQSANPSFVINGGYVLNPTEVSSGEDLYPIPGAQYYIVQYVSAEAPPDEIWKTGPSYCLGYGSKTVVCIITYSPFTFP